MKKIKEFRDKRNPNVILEPKTDVKTYHHSIYVEYSSGGFPFTFTMINNNPRPLTLEAFFDMIPFSLSFTTESPDGPVYYTGEISFKESNRIFMYGMGGIAEAPSMPNIQTEEISRITDTVREISW